MNELAARACKPCQGGTPPLAGEALASLSRQLPNWEVVRGHHLRREFRFPDFASALRFVNRVGEVAEAEGHHPDIELAWGRVAITTWTHKIDGLTESDFVLAAKFDELPRA